MKFGTLAVTYVYFVVLDSTPLGASVGHRGNTRQQGLVLEIWGSIGGI